MVGKQPIVLLKTVDGNRFLPIWIGHPEAAAILMKLQGASTPRPMTHDLLSDLLEQLDAKCEKVSVTELRDNTFYATITISINGSEMEIDSRPSDAIALAVRTQAPIFAAEDVIEESSIEFEHEVEDQEEVVEKFKDFLDEVSPEDFAARRGVADPGDRRTRVCAMSHSMRPRPGEGETKALTGALPPGPKAPSIYQGMAMWTRPLASLERYRSRYGKRFTVRLPFTPPFVIHTEPEQVKEIYTAPPDVLHPGEGARVLEPLVGKNSVILLDGDAHMEQRKLILPAFHGERMERLTELVEAVTAAEIGSWPSEEIALHPRLGALTLEIILRAVFGLDPGPRLDAIRAALTRLLAYGERPITIDPRPHGRRAPRSHGAPPRSDRSAQGLPRHTGGGRPPDLRARRRAARRGRRS